MSQDTKTGVAVGIRQRFGNLSSAVGALLLVGAFAFPYLPGTGQYEVFLLGQMLAFAIAALAYNVLLGYTGLLSFGHAAFFGGSAYAAGLAMQYYGMTELSC